MEYAVIAQFLAVAVVLVAEIVYDAATRRHTRNYRPVLSR